MGLNVASCFKVRKLHPAGSTTIISGLFLILFFSLSLRLEAQCALACKGKLNVSLAERCEAVLDPSQMLTGGLDCPNAKFRVDILDYGMKPIVSNPVITEDYLGMTLIAKVYDSTSTNSCWSSILIEEKHAPVVLCRKGNVYCNDSAIHYPPIFYDYCDPNPTIKKTWESITNFPCDSHFIKLVVRAWVAEDSRGNRSWPCVDSLWVQRVQIDSIEYPKDYVKADDCAIECNANYPKDANGNPHPDYTGSPSLHGVPIWPEYNVYCNLAVSYEDFPIFDQPCKKKILRIWRVVEWWCSTANIRTHQQYIEIADTKGPYVHCPYDLTVSTTSGYKCEAHFPLPPVEAHDSCQNSLTYEIYSDGLLVSRENGGYVTLPVGYHDVEYRVLDGCYNSSSCHVVVTVEDNNPPVAVCDNGTVVTMSRSDSIHVYAEVFDDGSHDECHLDSFLVRRMDNGAPCLFQDNVFRPYVSFCCEDVGKTIMVVFRVVDESGNTNECMVEVDVQDKTPPTISCPHDYTINCHNHVDTTNLTKFGGPNYSDNCVVTMTERVDTVLNQCKLGYFQRNFIVIDNMQRRDSCFQRIHVVNPNPFEEHQIIWPRDTTIYVCGRNVDPNNLPEGYNYPKFLDVECSLPAHSYVDEVFNYIEDSSLCFKVLRRWKVIDWCQQHIDSSGNKYFETWEHLQLIKVANKNPPKIEDDCEPITVCLSGNDCTKAPVRISHRASDDCTPVELLRSAFKLDYYNNGIIDSIYHVAGPAIGWDGELPLGTHKFFWIFEDQCGNEEICSQIVSVVNCKIPTAYCLTGIAVNLSSQDVDGDGKPEGVIDVWASDIDHGSFQICGNPVVLSFSRDSADRFRRYNCDSLGQRKVTLWVTDQITGLQDRCISTVTIQDNNGYCKGGNIVPGRVAGLVSTPDNRPIPSTLITIQGNNQSVEKLANKEYEFKDLLLGSNYTISVQNDQDYLNGISTLDIVKIQKHILGKENFSNVWQYWAADVTNDEKITSADISALRRLILGIDTKLKNSKSWNFVINTYQFPDLENPWQERIPNSYHYSGISGEMNYTDFYGVKVGDVSQTSWSAINGNIESRTKGEVHLFAQVLDDHKVGFFTDHDFSTEGMQFTLHFNAEKYRLNKLSSGQLIIENSHIGYQYTSGGLLLVSWNASEEVEVSKSRSLFVLEFDQKIDIDVLNGISISSDVLQAESYNALEELTELKWRDSAETTQLEEIIVGSPVPNPFYDYTSIMIEATTPSQIKYTISDLDGSILKENETILNHGKNQIRIKGNELAKPGIYLLKIEAPGIVKSMKLVKIDH
ncbi:MAG: T9SS type A sorting domain-containing protein [Saprospiraceae bacterium]|nr:T9SS type A sorting domain-containing protein [Saprospiraceae bacterium]